MTSTDKKIIESVIGAFDSFNNYVTEKIGGLDVVQHPLDQEIQTEVRKLDSMEDDEYAIFKKLEDIKKLWVTLVEKSIICLRYYDEREPFLANPNKKPQAYGFPFGQPAFCMQTAAPSRLQRIFGQIPDQNPVSILSLPDIWVRPAEYDPPE